MPIESVSATVDVIVTPTNGIDLTQKDNSPTRKLIIYRLQDGSLANCFSASTAAVDCSYFDRLWRCGSRLHCRLQVIASEPFFGLSQIGIKECPTRGNGELTKEERHFSWLHLVD